MFNHGFPPNPVDKNRSATKSKSGLRYLLQWPQQNPSMKYADWEDSCPRFLHKISLINLIDLLNGQHDSVLGYCVAIYIYKHFGKNQNIHCSYIVHRLGQ